MLVATLLMIMAIIGAAVYVFVEEIVTNSERMAGKGVSISKIAFAFYVVSLVGMVLEWVF